MIARLGGALLEGNGRLIADALLATAGIGMPAAGVRELSRW